MALFQAIYQLRFRQNFTQDFSFKMTVGKKNLGGFIIVIALVFIMSAFTYFKVDELNASSQEMMKKSLYQVGLVEELAIDVANEAVAMRGFIITGALSDVAAFEEARKYGDDKIIKLEKVLSNENARAFLETLKKEKGAYDVIATRTVGDHGRNCLIQLNISQNGL